MKNYTLPFDEAGLRPDEQKFIWYVDLPGSNKPSINMKGHADFKHEKKIEFVRKGQEIVSRLPVPARKSVDKGNFAENPIGQDDVSLIAGKNTLLSDDGLTLYSKIDGYAFWEEDKIHVDNVYHIKGDVDYSVGNVKFNGKVLIDGDVRSGFCVEAKDSIYVKGNIEAAELYSENGNIICRSGVLGKGQAKIYAGGNFHCRFVQDASISAKEDVFIEHYSINSHISAGGLVLLTQNEGLIRGGRIFAKDGIKAIRIGSDQYIPTYVGLRAEMFAGDSNRVVLGMKKNEINNRIAIINKKIVFFELLKNRLDSLSPEKDQEFNAIMKEKKILKKQLKSLQKEEDNLSKTLNEYYQKKCIHVEDTLFKGVTIAFGDCEFKVDKNYKSIIMYKAGNSIFIKND